MKSFSTSLCRFSFFRFIATSAGYAPVKDPKQRPSAFVSIHVSNEKILDEIRTIQQQLLAASSSFAAYLQPLESLHITLNLTAFKKEQLEIAKTSLEVAAVEFKKQLTDGFRLTFANFGVFNKCILFAEVKDDENKLKLSKLKDIVTEQFEAHQLPILGEFKAFHPHLSIVRLRYNAIRLNKKWKELVKKEIEFGVEDVTSIRLCAMGINPRTKDYTTLHEVSF
ncbi:hypothetical protein M3Y95_00963500 [Aphelenchoides besseyi]|nr:hypothetical protein M3Y95_00963500 [Aphelenchoides besseyi]